MPRARRAGPPCRNHDDRAQAAWTAGRLGPSGSRRRRGSRFCRGPGPRRLSREPATRCKTGRRGGEESGQVPLRGVGAQREGALHYNHTGMRRAASGCPCSSSRGRAGLARCHWQAGPAARRDATPAYMRPAVGSPPWAPRGRTGTGPLPLRLRVVGPPDGGPAEPGVVNLTLASQGPRAAHDARRGPAAE